MRIFILTWVVAATALGLAGAGLSGGDVTVTVADQRVDVKVGGKLFTALHTGQEARKLYLHPLLTASGKGVTRSFPMETLSGESTDHPHQRGVWIGAERVSDVDFWENEPPSTQPLLSLPP